MMADQPTPADWARIARHVAGDESPTDARATHAWIREDPRRAAAAESARRIWALTGDLTAAARAQNLLRAAHSDAGWHRMRARLHASDRTPDFVEPPGRPWRLAVRVAALAAAMLVTVVGLDLPGERHRTYTAPVGSRVTVFLPDGTRADLHPGTRLDVALASPVAALRRRLGLAADVSRRVSLAGEAVFTVRHDSARPFRVTAGGTVAEDLGTVFSVRAYPEDERVRIVVAEGEVGVRSASAPAGVEAVRVVSGQVAEVSRTGEIAVRSGEAASFGWTRDRLVFRRERARDVAVALSRWFGRPVLVPDAALADRRITLDQPITSVDAAAAAVAAVLGASLTEHGDTIRILRP
ncbi:MAG: FecR family protein [Gemmatimonadaceae bacterium]